jgi:hypothetical protein
MPVVQGKCYPAPDFRRDLPANEWSYGKKEKTTVLPWLGATYSYVGRSGGGLAAAAERQNARMVQGKCYPAPNFGRDLRAHQWSHEKMTCTGVQPWSGATRRYRF